jgi:acyl-CoA synthetase (AMP-forming)/AMP-acid ligase II
VMVSHGNVLANIDMSAAAFGADSTSRIVSWLPPHHDMGLVVGVLAPLKVGYHAALMDPLMFIQRPLRWIDALSSQRATITGGPSFAYGLCAAEVARRGAAGLDLSAMKVAFCGAEPIQEASLRAFAGACAPFGFDPGAWIPCYGMSETTLMAASVAAGEGLRTIPRPGGAPSVDCGVAWGDGAVIVVDPDTGELRPDGVEGEIWVHGPHVAKGYIGREDETLRAFHAHTDPDDGRGYLRTGDLGTMISGRLHITGRLKNMIIVHGQKHCPEDIEATILSGTDLPVSAAGAFAVTSIDGAETLVLMLETALHAGPADERDGLALAARRAVTASHGLVPSAVHLLRPGAIPRTGNGKLRRDGFAFVHQMMLGRTALADGVEAP